MAPLEEVSPFFTALATHRDRYNAQFRLARHRSKNLDANAFLNHLKDFVGPVVDAAANAGGDPVEVTDALIDLSFASHGRLPLYLKEMLLEHARFVAMDPRRVPVALANALHHMHAEPETSVAAWQSAMRKITKDTGTVQSFLDLGAFAAWRYGLAPLRDSVLPIGKRLDPAILRELFITTDIATLEANPWRTIGFRGVRVVRRVGTFRGFGGTFVKPPTVFFAHGRLHATDGEGTWRVYADGYGGSLRRTEPVQPEHQSPTLTLAADGTVQSGGKTQNFPELAQATSWVSYGNTIAVTTPWTHAITFVADV